MIKIICMGKIKEDYLNKLIDDYKKRISRYHKIEIIELNDSNDLQKESVDILKHINNQDYVIALDIHGENLDSVELAKKIDSTFLNYGTITFIIGSSFGLHEDVKRRANYKLSFSKLTFPHGLFRGILLEQIYRSFKILNNETYHK
ncbi:MAG: 23S rRNA (pseudouridine(1915)-N(3))-methyltransferase RlmH [Firmicutes bacterium]|nr:23S rRNA (pseudouridine(1915)-N(3))-methyltransferase RlmH [Bacillota bacterium]